MMCLTDTRHPCVLGESAHAAANETRGAVCLHIRILHLKWKAAGVTAGVTLSAAREVCMREKEQP